MADESCIKEAIRSRDTTMRMIGIITATALLMLLLIAGIAVAVLLGVHILGMKGFDIQYSVENGIKLCSPSGKSLTIVDVPAY